ncbi:MAG: hypothetical protein L0H23_00370 [Luteimonas sp.]|nr:hypothetical protein [Luteimonas sp.]
MTLPRMTLPRSLDPDTLRRDVPGFAYWFRYPLHAHDFHPLRADDDVRARLLGYYAAKPLFGKLDAHGRVDKSTGFNGAVVALFVPSPARSWRRARLVHARMPRQGVRRADGTRNWPAIRRTAEAAIRRSLAAASQSCSPHS